MAVVLINHRNKFFALLYKDTFSNLILPSMDVLPFEIALLVEKKKKLFEVDKISNNSASLIKSNTSLFLLDLVESNIPKECKLQLCPLPIGIRNDYLSNVVKEQHVLMCMNSRPENCSESIWKEICFAFLFL